MYLNQLTYEKLKTYMQERLGQARLPKASSFPNSLSALNEFLRERGIEPGHVIGQTLRANFHKELSGHVASLHKALRQAGYIKTRKWLLGAWYRLMRTLDHEGAKEDRVPTPLQIRLRNLMNGRRYHTVARRAGTTGNILARWCNGVTPRPASNKILADLEQFFDLEPNALVDLLPYRADYQTMVTSGGAEIPYRIKLARLSADEYFIKNEQVPMHARNQWRAFALAKIQIPVPPSVPRGVGKPKEPTILERVKAQRAKGPSDPDTKNSRWKIEPLDYAAEVGADDSWPWEFNEQHCSSAKPAFAHMQAFWGWATISTERGGAELSVEDVSLGQLADKTLLKPFLDWKITRSENVNNGHIGFLRFISSVNNPEFGFLTKHGQEAGVAPPGLTSEEWLARCLEAYLWARDELQVLEAVGVVRSRDPSDAARGVLMLPVPLDGIMQAIRRMDLVKPRKDHIASHERDKTLLAMMSSNPLRAKQYQQMTYCPDGSGHLYDDPNVPGGYRIHIPKIEFKNYLGAANHEDYDQAVDPAVWPYLRRYINEFRPMIGGSRAELFVSSKHPDVLWGDGLNRQFFEITTKYVSNCDGFGPHSMRGIVATTIIERGGGTKEALVDAAACLHDMPDTVAESYKLLCESSGDRRRAAILGPVLKGMAPRPLYPSSRPDAPGAPEEPFVRIEAPLKQPRRKPKQAA
jgi:hypothetical protein